MNKLRRTILLALGLIPMMMPVHAAVSSDSIGDADLRSSVESSQWSKSRFSIEAQSGSRSIGTLDAMLPIMGDNDFIVYSNIKAKMGSSVHASSGTAIEGNLGLGIRRVNDQETAIYGVYGFYDYLNSVNNNTFQQITVGAERLGLTWDFRANAYLPIGKTEYNKNIYDDAIIDNHDVIAYYKTNTETAMAGGDLEVGRTLGSNQLRGYAALYSFGKDLTGPRMRLEYNLTKNIKLNGSVQYDNNRSFQYLLGVRYSIGGATAKNSKSIYNRLTDEVVRDADIATIANEVKNVNIDVDKFWAVDPSSGQNGNGTLDHPFDTLEKAIQAAPENAIIYVKGQTNTVGGPANTVTMKDGQNIWGGQNALYWNFDNNRPSYTTGDNTILLQAADGVRQTISGTIKAANNTGIYGIDIVANRLAQQQNGILVDNKQNVIVQDVKISGFKSQKSEDKYHGINVIGNSTVNLLGVNLTGNDYGLYANGGEITANHLAIDNSSASGMMLLNANLEANSISVNNSAQHGIYLQNSSLKADNVSTSNNQFDGINLDGSQVNLGTVNLTHNGKDGLNATASNVTINDLTLTNNQNGLVFNGGDLNVINAEISNNLQHGVNLLSGSASFDTIRLNANGDLAAAKDEANSLRDLQSAVRIGSDGAAATFNASHLTATNNEAGIELIAGQLNINSTPSATSQTQSLIDNNLGYGIFIHADNGQAAGFSRSVNIQNTDIVNTHKLTNKDSEYGTSGHGILSENVNTMVLNNMNINQNEGNGIWHKRGNLTGRDINLIANGTVANENINTDNNINHFNYGLRIDQVDSALPSNVTLENIKVHDSTAHGLLVTGGDITLINLESKNNVDGIQYLNGKLNLYNALLEDNKRFGLYVKYDGNYASQQTDNHIHLYDSFIKGTKNNDYEFGFIKRGTGHGIAIEGMRSPLSDEITLNNTEIDHNDGLGIYIANDALLNVLNRSRITHNAGNNVRLLGADGIKAGGIYEEFRASPKSKIVIDSSLISNNFGSGILFWGGNGTQHILKIKNSTIEKNKGIGLRMDHGLISNSNIVNNELINQFWKIKLTEWSPGSVQGVYIMDSTIDHFQNIT